MSGQVFMRRGASLTHRRRHDDVPEGFAHSICGLSFAKHPPGGGVPQVIELGEDAQVTCAECQTIEDQQVREQMLAALPRPAFTPKPSAQDAMAWMGPKVEVLNVVRPDGATDVTVFLDGIEVPLPHLTVADVDPGRGHLRSAWEDETRRVIGDVTMTSPFRSLVAQERNYALHRDAGIYIVSDHETDDPILKEA